MINSKEVDAVAHKRGFALKIFVALVITLSVFTTTVFAAMDQGYEVTINDNGNVTTVVTEEEEASNILQEANITLSDGDKLDISDFTAGEGGEIVIDRLNTVSIDVDGDITTYNVYGDTVDEALAEVGVDATDCILNYSKSALIEDGMVITVSKASTVTIKVDGEKISITAAGGTVEDVLEFAGIELGENDYTKPSLTEEITDGVTITVYRVEIETVTKTKTIEYETIEEEDKTLELGETKIETEGVDGEKEVTYEITYVNGEVSEKEVISSVVTKEAVDEVKIVGTMTADIEPNGVESYNGYTLGQEISGKYTYYCCCTKCCGKSNGVTSSGKKVYMGMDNPYYIACNWLPLGSVVEIDGDYYTVVDRGGSSLSKAGRVDIFTPVSHSYALKMGTGSCTVTIIRFGW